MAPKPSPKKVVKNEDRVKIGSILDKEGFLRQHDNFETARKIMKGFEDSSLLTFVTFDYGRIHKKEVVEFYLNTRIGNNHITSKVKGKEVTINVEDIRTDFELPLVIDLDVSTHTFNQKTFWEEIHSESAPAYVKFSRKKNVLLKPIWERAIDIVYKYLESKVIGVDDITTQKITLLHCIIHNYKCDWAKHIFDCLGMFIYKVLKKGFKDLQENVG